jgi:hypothetical protein
MPPGWDRVDSTVSWSSGRIFKDPMLPMTWDEFEIKHARHGGTTGSFGGSSRGSVRCECGALWLGDTSTSELGFEYR